MSSKPKVALLISGQPRYSMRGYQAIKPNIIDQADVDVFCHVWKPNPQIESKFATTNYDPKWVGYQPTRDDIENNRTLYKPKTYIEMNQIDFKSDVGIGDSINRYYWGLKEAPQEEKDRYASIMKRNSMSMFYGIYHAFTSMMDYSLETNTKYDFIARTRYDLIPTRPINFHSLPKDAVSYEEMGQPDGMISDWLNIGPRNRMIFFAFLSSSWHSLVNELLQKNNAWCNEMIIKTALEHREIQSVPQSWGLSIVRP